MCVCVCVCVCVAFVCEGHVLKLICCWTEIMSVRTKSQLCMVGHNTKVK